MLTNSASAPVTIGILVGSDREGSVNQRLADVVGERIPAPHRSVQLGGMWSLPFFTEALEANPPATVEQFHSAVRDVDALLLVTPQYNGGMPAVLKNAVDWLSRPRETATLSGLPAAVIGASPSPRGPVKGVENAALALMIGGARVVDETFAVSNAFAPEAYDDLRGLDAVLDTLVQAAAEAASAAAA